MQHVELVRLRALLTDGQDLEPAKALCLFENANKIVPFFARERSRDIDLEALQVRLMLRLDLLILFFLYRATTLLFLGHGI